MAYVTVSGLTTGLYVPITVIGTASNIAILVTQPGTNPYSIASTSGYTTTLTGWFAQNGTVIDLRATSSTEYAQTTYVTLEVGGTSSTWYLTTENAPNNAPNPAPVFTALANQALNTVVYSDVQQITGLTASAQVVVLGQGGNGLSNTAYVGRSASPTTTGGILTGANFSSSTITISNGDYIQLKQTTSTSNNSNVGTSVTIGTGIPVIWDVSTGSPSDTLTDTFSFQNIIGATPSTQYFSSINSGGTAYTVSGLGTGVSVPLSLVSYTSTSSPLVSKNGGSIGTFPTNVANGDTIRIYMTSSSSYSQTVSTQVSIGAYQPNPWTISTSATADTNPDAISFVNAVNRPQSTATTSNAVAITGIATSVNVTTTNGALISKNGGSYVSSPVSVVEGDTISLRLTSSASLNTAVSTTVTVGSSPGVTASWSVTTYAAVPTTTAMYGQWYSKKMVVNNTNSTRREQKEDGLAIGTVLPVTKFQDGNFGTLDGTMSSRFPGWMECDGTSLSAATYWELWKVIGNTYGGTGAYDSITKVYSGTFKLPNYKNRKLVGVGGVDGNNASSVSVTTYKGPDPSLTSTGDSNLCGSSGGNWIIDTIDSSASKPPEQVYDGSPNDIDGSFFALGSVRTTGYSGITSDVEFAIGANGFISATVGPLQESFTKIGAHNHFALTGEQVDEDISYIGWGVPTYGGAGTSGSGGYDDRWIAPKPSPPDALYGPSFAESTVTYGWWWRSDKSNTPNLDNSAGNYLAMIDTTATNASVTPYDAGAFGGQLTHSHYLSETSFGNPQNAYGWGNISGSGTVGGTFPTTYGNTLNVVFNQSQLQISANTATFKLASTKQVVPTVNLVPQKRIPLMTKYFKIKYLIKVY
jgi:hypothetical protein